MEQNKSKESKAWISNVSQQTLEQFKRAFVQKCVETGSTELQLKYDELAEISGLSKGAVFKAVEVLSAQGFIERRPAPSRRIANTYILKGPIDIEIPKKTEEVTFETGDDLINTVASVRSEIAQLKKENERLRAILKEEFEGEIQVVAETELPGGMKQLIYQIKKDTLEKKNA